MQLYEKRKKNYSFIINFWRCNNIALYKNYVYFKVKTSLVRCSDYFREQYYAFRN